MAAGAFDTLTAMRELQAAGIQAGQAEAIVTAIHRSSGEHVSASELKSEMAELRGHVDVSVSALRSELAELRAHIDTSIAGLRGELYRALWLQAAAIVGTLTALDTLLGG